MKKLIPVLFFCIAVVGLRAGEPTITATILVAGTIKEGEFSGIMEREVAGHPGLRFEAKVENQSADPIELCYGSCSWIDQWEIVSDGHFIIPKWDCEKNVSIRRILHPGDKAVFAFAIAAEKKDEKIEGRIIKLGFIWGPNKVLWSKNLVVPKSSDQLISVGQ
jgi:hypothetical protein